jgi:hypothetical protein
MNKVFFIGLTVLSAALSGRAALADMHVDCKLSGQSDARTLAPRTVRLENFDSQWIFTENKKVMPYAAVEMKAGDAIAVSHSGVVAGSAVSFQYTFRVGGCDSTQAATATLMTKVVGESAGGRGPSQVTSVYDCTCSVD